MFFNKRNNSFHTHVDTMHLTITTHTKQCHLIRFIKIKSITYFPVTSPARYFNQSSVFYLQLSITKSAQSKIALLPKDICINVTKKEFPIPNLLVLGQEYYKYSLNTREYKIIVGRGKIVGIGGRLQLLLFVRLRRKRIFVAS